jgi:3-oxoacyl-[acyl-carrier-protein] synthase III
MDAVATAVAMLRCVPDRRALVVGGEVYSGILDWHDRS